MPRVAVISILESAALLIISGAFDSGEHGNLELAPNSCYIVPVHLNPSFLMMSLYQRNATSPLASEQLSNTARQLRGHHAQYICYLPRRRLEAAELGFHQIPQPLHQRSVRLLYCV